MEETNVTLTIEEKLHNTSKLITQKENDFKNHKLAINFIKKCIPHDMDEDMAIAYIKQEISTAFHLVGKDGKPMISDLVGAYKKEHKRVQKEIEKSAACGCFGNIGGDECGCDESDKIDPRDIDYDEEGISEERQISAKAEALEIMKNGDPINKILTTVEKIHVGDNKFQELFCVAVASQSCLNTAGIQASLHGSAGSGKSHAVKSHAHTIRAKYKLESTLSAKAAYYNHLKPGCIIISDDTEPNEALEETIKRSITNFQEKTIHTTVHDGKGESHMIPERLMWLFTSVSHNGSDQLSDRQVKCNTTETKGHKQTACDKQLEESADGKYGLTEIDDDILICRYIYDIIKSQTFRVRVPYAKRIKFHITDNLRNTQRFLDMIKGYAVLYHMQRETDENGYLMANEWDFELAKDLFNSQIENAVSKLTEKERRISKYIADNSPCTISEISNGTGYSDKVTRTTINGKPNQISGGLLEKVAGLSVSRENHTERINEEKSVCKTADYYSIKIVEGNWELFNNKFVELVY